MIVNLLFYFFSSILILSSLMIVISQNSIYSVLFLVLSFVSSVCILFLLGCEFISLMFIIIYVGAIAVLFLFVVMMLDVKTINLTKDSLKYLPFGSFVGVVFLSEIIMLIPKTFDKVNPYSESFLSNLYVDWFFRLDHTSDIVAIGQILYTDYILQFLIAGNILLLAVIGPVILTLTITTKSSKKQITFRQLSRSFKFVLFTR